MTRILEDIKVWWRRVTMTREKRDRLNRRVVERTTGKTHEEHMDEYAAALRDVKLASLEEMDPPADLDKAVEDMTRIRREHEDKQ